MLPLLLISLLFKLLKCTQADEYLLQAKSLPLDLNFMPSLSNGHLGFTVFGDAIYVNGIYNGYNGESRRARLPNWLNLSLTIEATETGKIYQPTVTTYEMNLKTGQFRWRQNYNDLGLSVEQTTYAHRYYNRALMYELELIAADGVKAPLQLKLKIQPGNDSDAFVYSDVSNSKYKIIKARTKIMEHEKFQTEPSVVYIVFSEQIQNEKSFNVPKGQQALFYRYIIALDPNKGAAEREMNDLIALDSEQIHNTHRKMWLKFWKEFNISIRANLELSQIINAGIFYIVSSLPSLESNQANDAYGGLSPTGLGRGQLDADYEGHNFWDTEIWMLPIVTQFNAEWSRQLLEYRRLKLAGARYIANISGYSGARFPWESAFTGTEVVNLCCPEIAEQQIHITADIAFALQQYYATTNDEQWLCNEAWPLLKEIAEFLEQRVTWNNATEKYHVKDVMGPDEDHEHVDDNVYTNYVFKMAFEFAGYTQSQCHRSALLTNNWRSIAEKMFILYDEELDYHPQYMGYKRNTEIKQADAILLGYPLQLKMNASTRLNDLHTYEHVTRASGPAMTWSMFAINFLDLKQYDKAHKYFERSYMDYIRHEFKVWSEVVVGYNGSSNFITGVGGFLQAIVNGYAGLRFYHSNAKSIMEIRGKYLLPRTEEWYIHGIKFSGSTFDMAISGDNIAYICCITKGKKKLQMLRDNEISDINEGEKVELDSRAVLIQTIGG